MSHPHPTISEWQRDEHEGHYVAELHGWKLTVAWTPNTKETRGSFHWTAERDGEDESRSERSYEEMENAMADAEAFAKERGGASAGDDDGDDDGDDEQR